MHKKKKDKHPNENFIAAKILLFFKFSWILILYRSPIQFELQLNVDQILFYS